MNRTIFILLAAVICLSMNTVYAKPITYTYTGTASGNVNGTVFSNSNVTITAYADTQNVLFDGVNLFNVIPSSTIIEIAGIGSGKLTGDILVYNLQAYNYSFAGLLQDTIDIVIVEDPDLELYDLTTSFGPLAYGYLSIYGSAELLTTMGTVTLDSSGNFTFQAETLGTGCGDSDNDGIDDCLDYCPYEDSTGLDADGDGCIDSFSGLTGRLQTLFTQEMIERTLQNSLTIKVMNAQAMADKNNTCAAVNKLEALKKEVNAQRGKKVADESANLIVTYDNSLIIQLLNGLPAGETCR
jgi:hypothetical protein